MFGKRGKPHLVQMTQLSSLVAEGVTITGDVEFQSGMRVDGRIVGNVVGRQGEAQTPALLVLSSKGRIDGSVSCGDALINGVVNGDLDIASRLELQSDARVCGTIRYRQLQMDVGAIVQGQLIGVMPADVVDNVVELGSDKPAGVAERH